ncbi:hypothetical protein EDD18DRAFT_846929 [Armillaria luteobubalina]|uniref:Uncharacterized protein n=1 Tax=Armillaria luteobubalina TaxID=153913 RepID=A0AA39P960_9AGAR|nr:hypothetical protein EDD18DRAFT_846929 [Armillaria luteobubalina]
MSYDGKERSKHIEDKAASILTMPHVEAQTLTRRRPSVLTRVSAIAMLFILFFFVEHALTAPRNAMYAVSRFFGAKEQDHNYYPYEWPIPHDLIVDQCAEFQAGEFWNGEQSATGSFDLPLNSDKLFLLARGSYTSGWVYIDQSEEVSFDTARVEVTVGYQDNELELTKVCKVSRPGNENGIGFFTPRHAHRNRISLRFDVRVLLPKTPLTIQDFRTDLPLFSQQIGALETVFFESITLHGAMMPIYAESVSTAVGKVKNANSPIEGNFNTSTSLDLATANSAINVVVGLFNADGEEPTSVSMETANGPISAGISLLSTAPSSTGGKFNVKVNTARGKIELGFIDASVDSALDLQAHTAMGPVDVTMHPTYEGEFRLATVLGRAEVTTDNETEDPKGEDRKRSVSFERAGGSVVSGRVWWGEEGKGKGTADLKTSLSGVKLAL